MNLTWGRAVALTSRTASATVRRVLRFPLARADDSAKSSVIWSSAPRRSVGKSLKGSSIGVFLCGVRKWSEFVNFVIIMDFGLRFIVLV